MHDSHALSGPLQTGIGLFYFLVALMNLGFAAYQHYERKNKLQWLVFRRYTTLPEVAWTILMFTLWFGGLAMTNDNFKNIITKPDNVPIVMLIFSVGFTTWLAMRKAVINDDRI